MNASYVRIRRGAVPQWCDGHGLEEGVFQLLLYRLIELVDWRDHTLTFTYIGLAEELGFGGANGRRTLAHKLEQLIQAGAIALHSKPRRGTGGDGTLELLIWSDLVADSTRDRDLNEPETTRAKDPFNASLARVPTRPKDPFNARWGRESGPENPGLPGQTPALRSKDLCKTLDLTDPALPEGEGQGQGSSRQSPQAVDPVALLAARLPAEWRPAFGRPADAGCRLRLAAVLERLVSAAGGADAAVALMTRDFPPAADVNSPAAFLLRRAERKLDDVAGSAALAAATASVMPDPVAAVAASASARAETLASVMELDDDECDEILERDYRGNPAALHSARAAFRAARDRLDVAV